MGKQLEVIVIPSGNTSDDLVRLRTAFSHAEVARSEGKEVRYILSGVGPDLNERLKQEKSSLPYLGPFSGTNGLDVHPELYSEAVKEVKLRYEHGEGFEPVGVDVLSVNSVQNMINTFPRGSEGKYTIVSRALHNTRFKMIEKEARKKGYFSDKLKLTYLNTPDSFSIRNIVYDLVHLAKFFVSRAKIGDSIPA